MPGLLKLLFQVGCFGIFANGDGADTCMLQTSGRQHQARLPICITGQIQRLELKSKIEHVIKPAVDAGYRVEVYLVLDPRLETKYVHMPSGIRIGNYTITQTGWSSLNETVRLFPSNVSVILDPFIPHDYSIDPSYVTYLRQFTHPDDRMDRAKSHMRQWEVLDRCWTLIERLADQPQIAMRLREDVGFMEDFVPPSGLAEGIHVKNCYSRDGLNDHAALVSGEEAIKSYFTQPLAMMLHDFTKVLALQKQRGLDFINPESILFNVMTLSKVKMHSLDKFPFSRLSFIEDARHGVRRCHYVIHGTEQECFSKELWTRIETTCFPVRDGKSVADQLWCEENVESRPI